MNTSNVLQLNTKVAVYARVSSTKQENEGTIETQLSAIKAFAAEKQLTIIEEYLDNGWGGDTIIRPALDKLRVDAKNNKWDAVLMYDPDRLARRYSYQELIVDELKEAGKGVLFVTTPAPTNSIEKILYGVQGLFAEYERAKITERFRLGKIRKATEGNIQMSEAPFGYTYIKKQGKRGDNNFKEACIIPNTAEVVVLLQIFKWVGEDGMTIRQLVKALHEHNMLPRRSSKGTWSTSTLSTLLRNKTYIGEAFYGTTHAVVPKKYTTTIQYRKVRKTTRVKRPTAEWISIKTPPLIDKSLFEKVQLRLQQNFHHAKRNSKYAYLLSGLIWCICGKRRAGEGNNKRNYYCYRCTGRTQSFPLENLCAEKSIEVKKTDTIVWEAISKLLCSPKLIEQQWKRYIDKQKNTTASLIDENVIQKETLKLQEQQKRYAKAYGEGLISLDQFKEFIKPLEQQIVQLQKQVAIEEKNNEAKAQIPTKIDFNKLVVAAKKTLSTMNIECKKEVLKSVVERVIGTPKNLVIKGYIPFDSSISKLCSNERDNTNTILHKNPLRNIGYLIKGVPFEVKIDLSKSNKNASK